MLRYAPPNGYFDLPFTWVYDGNGLTDGQNALNQSVYIQGGYGDFVLRRVVGLSRVLETAIGEPGLVGGRFQIYDRTRTPLQAVPIYANGNPSAQAMIPLDLAIAPERIYPETGNIRFDLLSVEKATAATAQVAFQGVRRMKGVGREVNPRVVPKTYIYQQYATIAGLAGTVADVLVRQPIENFDFELHELRILKQTGGTAGGSGEATASVQATANFGQPAFTFTLDSNFLVPNQVFSLVVVPGVSITINGATDAAGNKVTSGNDLLAAYNADAAAVAMATLFVADGGFTLPDIGPQVIGGTAFSVLDQPYAGLWLRDSNRIAVASSPVLDVFMDGTPEGPYQDGAIVPPLYYPKDSTLQIDVRSVMTDPSLVPATLLIMLVGRQMIPC